MRIYLPCVAAGATLATAAAENMNGVYMLANSDTNPDLATFGGAPSESFTVYSPNITTLYSQIYWQQMDAVPLPEDIVARFANGKVMAITGYETDQVLRGAGPNGEDVSVPITWTYNHHHNAHIIGKAGDLVRVTPEDELWAAVPETDGHLMKDSLTEAWLPIQTEPTKTGAPASQRFAHGNGGEYRKSFHGYPRGYAQLVESPQSWRFMPMQIDTWNREKMRDVTDPFVPGPVPGANNLTGIDKRVGSLAPLTGPDAIYSGLLECPCTDRITKVQDNAGNATRTIGGGGGAVDGDDDDDAGSAANCPPLTPQQQEDWGAAQCFDASAEWTKGLRVTNSTVSSQTDPAGCSFSLGSSLDTATVVWNTNNASAMPCGGHDQATALHLKGAQHSALTDVSLGVELFPNGSTVLTIEGPAGVWFGVGLNATSMADLPYTIVVEGDASNTTVVERQLADQAPGTILSPPSVEVQSVQVEGKRRKVVLAGKVSGSYFSFNPRGLALPYINAIGSSPTFAYHKAKTGDTLQLQVETPGVVTCVCPPEEVPFGQGKGKVFYNPGTGPAASGSAAANPFRKACALIPPQSNDMIANKNTECDIRTYQGGLECCHHMWSLLPLETSLPWRDQPLTFHHKWKFYFQEYNASSLTNTPTNTAFKESDRSKFQGLAAAQASHQDIVGWGYGGMASPTEYEVPACDPGTPVEECVHEIHGRFTVADWSCTDNGQKDWPNATGLHLVTLHGHCHAPTCISMDLYNNATGELICRQQPTYGNATPGERFEEDGYINTPPCVWGPTDLGLDPPYFLNKTTALYAVTRTNNTYGHHGEMSLWQVYGTIVV